MHHHRLFSDKSDLYQRSRPMYPSKVFDYLASISPSTTLAWDSACGNGQAAMGLAEKFDNVYATDISAEQIANAKPHPRVTYVVTPSERTALENASVDIVCVAQALHWFDFELFWPEVHRVLKPDGVFVAMGYNGPTIGGEIGAVIKESILDVIEPYWAPNNRLLWNHYREVQFPFEKINSPPFIMYADWNLDEYFNFIHTFSATRRCMDDIGDEFFNKAYVAVAQLWGDVNFRKTLDLDFVLYVGRSES